MDPTAAQQMMIDDGLPAALVDDESRRAARAAMPKINPAPPKAAQTTETTMPTTNTTAQTKADQVAALRVARATKPAPAAARKAEKPPAKKAGPKTAARAGGAPKPPAGPKNAKPAKAAAKPAKAAPAVRPDGLRAGSKMAVMIDMALAPGGATEAAMCKKLGWAKCRVTLVRTAARVGATLTTSKNDKGETVFQAAMPKGKA